LARDIAIDAGLHYVYTGNVHDSEGGTTFCPHCDAALIVRDWYDIRRYELAPDGSCPHCHTPIAGRFGPALGHDGSAFGARRIPIRVAP
ncbi:MAG TPA: AmmeMemoRadiSam system radical SAM enzyme, partial [Azonexus sp.]|nr:AmmeMemoRadiSam system radical SAM enzyme [Azonexus sp.]